MDNLMKIDGFRDLMFHIILAHAPDCSGCKEKITALEDKLFGVKIPKGEDCEL